MTSDLDALSPRIKLLLLIPHLGGGGAERVTSLLAIHLNPDLFEIHLALLTPDYPGAIPAPASVTPHRFDVPRVRSAWLPMVRLARSLSPDVILCGMAHLNFLLLLLKPLLPRHTKILLRQNTTASAATARTWLTRRLYLTLYPRADAIICQSPSMALDLELNFHIPPSKLAVLHNPISPQAPASTKILWRPDSWPRLLAVGRLAPEKGIDLLLQSVATLKQRHPHLELIVLGTGPEEIRLRQLSTHLRLDSTVQFAGHAPNPSDYYPGATLFVRPSRYEGMPNALLEAASVGLPLVSTPCCQGVIELLRDQPCTWLATEITAPSLAEAIATALQSLATSLEPRCHHNFLAPFETETAIHAYEQFILRIAGSRP
jgi:glycosyltransferase involved in cell wall biosynthesis